MSSYFQDRNVVQGVNSTVTSGGTLALVASSKTNQRFTGTQSHTVTLPDATTLKNAGRLFIINNRSTGTITVNNFSATLIATLAAGTQRTFLVSDVSSSAGVWELAGDNGSSSGSGATISPSDSLKLLQGIAGINYNDGSLASKRVKINPEEIGADVWASKSLLTAAKRQVSGASFNGYAYCLSGESGGSALTNVDKYNDDNNYWFASTVLPVGANDAVTLPQNGFLYFISDVLNTQFNDATSAWSAKGALLTSRTNGAGFALNNYIHFAGGQPGGSGETAIVERYDDTLNAWNVRSSLLFSCYDAAYSDLNGKGYVIAGISSSAFSSNVQKYSDAENSWLAAASYPVTRSALRGFTINGLLYACTGANPSNTRYSENYQFNEAGNSWALKASLAVDRYYAGSASLNGQGYVFGGQNTATSYQNTVEQYKNANFNYLGSFFSSAILPVTVLVSAAVKNLTASVPVRLRTDGDTWRTLLANVDSAVKTGETLKGKFNANRLMYALGGSSLATSEIYSDTQNTWTNRASAPAIIDSSPAEFSLDGFAFYAGGFQGGSISAATVKYDDITNVYTSKSGVLSAARYGMPGNSTLLGFGYVTAGRVNGGTYVTTTEKYNSTLDSYTAVTSKISAENTHCNTVLHDRLYAIGGENVGYHNYNEQYDPILNAWASKAVVSSILSGPVNWTLNDFMYHNSGSNGATYVTTTEKYNDQTDAWSTAASSSSGRFAPGVSRLNGYAYVFGGSSFPSGTFSSVERFNDGANAWTNMTSMNTARSNPVSANPGTYRKYEIQLATPAFIGGVGAGVWVTKKVLPSVRNSPYAVNVNGSLFVAAGYNGGGLNDTYKYNKQANTWVAGSTFPVSDASSGNSAAQLEGFGYAVGGALGGATTAVKKLNGATEIWSTGTAANIAYLSNGVMSLNGKLYVSGDNGGGGIGTNNSQFDPSTSTWTTKGSLTQGKDQNPSSSVNGFGYNFGGYDGTNSLTITDKYNDASDTWTQVAAHTNTHRGAGSAMANGVIYVYGGLSTASVYGNNMEYYNDAANVWSVGPSKVTNAYGTAGAELDGTVFSMGGINVSTYQDAVEQFVPSLNSLILGVGLEVK